METGEMLKEICKRLSDVESDISEINYKNSDTDKNIDKIADDLLKIGCTDRETALFYLDKLKGTEYFDDIIKIDSIAKLYSGSGNEQHNSPDITTLKKRIKYCKNPLEKKNLQQELNVAYKLKRGKK